MKDDKYTDSPYHNTITGTRRLSVHISGDGAIKDSNKHIDVDIIDIDTNENLTDRCGAIVIPPEGLLTGRRPYAMIFDHDRDGHCYILDRNMYDLGSGSYSEMDDPVIAYENQEIVDIYIDWRK